MSDTLSVAPDGSNPLIVWAGVASYRHYTSAGSFTGSPVDIGTFSEGRIAVDCSALSCLAYGGNTLRALNVTDDNYFCRSTTTISAGSKPY